MKTIFLAARYATLVAPLLLLGCGSPTKVTPVSERMAKVWTASKVNQNTTTVYTKGGTANTVPGYSNFRLDLSSSATVRFIEFDNNTFTGTWSVPSDNRLVLTGLTPAPTGTGGTIEFTIGTLNDTQLELTRTTASPKTGGSLNTYTLSDR